MSDDLSAPPDVPAKRKRGVGFWLLVAGGALLVVCGGGALLAWHFSADWIAIARAPEGEREALLSKKLGEMAGDQTAAVDSFVAAVDESRDDDAWAATSERFRATTSREKFGELTSLVRTVVGRCKSKRLRSLNAKQNLGGSTVSSLAYGATFEKGDGGIAIDLESVDGVWKVLTWRTNSPLFEQAMKRGAGK